MQPNTRVLSRPAGWDLPCFMCEGMADVCRWCDGKGFMDLDEQARWASIHHRTRTNQKVLGLPLAGYTFAASGRLSGYTRETFEDDVEANGGDFSESVNRNVDVLVVGHTSGTTSKMEKAQTLGTTMMTEADYEAMKLKRRKRP